MRDLILWKDEVVEHPYRYKETVNTDGSVDHKRDPGEVIQAGTPQNAENFNKMDSLAAEALINGLYGEVMTKGVREILDALSETVKSDESEEKVYRAGIEDTEAEHRSLVLWAMSMLRKAQIDIDGLKGEIQQVEFTNTESYPFNNSQKTIALSTPRNTKNYVVVCEIAAKGTGGVGDIIVSDKLLNGFKVRYTGAAPTATLNLYVIGGV